jgi:hypothetical protein
MGPNCSTSFPVVGERSNNMEKKKKHGLEKNERTIGRLRNASLTTLTILVLLFAFGISATSPTKDAVANPPNTVYPSNLYWEMQYHDAANMVFHSWIPEYRNNPAHWYTEIWDTGYDNWNLVSPEAYCRVGNDAMTASDFVNCVTINRTDPVPWTVRCVVAASPLNQAPGGSVWEAANPTYNDFLINPLEAYWICYEIPQTWIPGYDPDPDWNPSWDEPTEPLPPVPPPAWDFYGPELLFPYGECTPTASLSLAANSYTITGMFGTSGWYPGTHTAWEVGLLNLFDPDGSPYSGYFLIAKWDCNPTWQGWHTYDPGNPSTNFVLSGHMGLKIWVGQPAIWKWTV